VIGGGVSLAGSLLFDPIRETVRQYARPILLDGVHIVPAALGDKAGLLGGVALALSLT
jgi:glucokinase